MIFYVGKIGLLDLLYNACLGIEERRNSDCWSFFSKVDEILPRTDVGRNILVATVTGKTFG